jgi:hypothetical protein
MRHTNTVFIIGLALFSVSLNLFAKTAEIGVAAIAVEAELLGKGEFKANDNVDEGDGVKTHPKGTTTILFNDESILTLGPNAVAKIEVYQEGTKSKPGKSIIRVVKGQFRYIPGTILQNGGSQFVAVGDRLLGKSNARDGDSASAAQSANASSTGTTQSAGHNASESEHGNQSNGNGQSGDGHGSASSAGDSDHAPNPVAEGETSDSSPAVEQASIETEGGSDTGGEHSGGTSSGGSSNPGLNADSFVVAGMGLGTSGGGTGGTGGVQYNCHEPPCGGLGGFGGVVGGNMIPGDNFMIAGTVEGGATSFSFLDSAGQALAGLDGNSLSGSFNFASNLQADLGAGNLQNSPGAAGSLQTNLGGAGSLQTNLGGAGSISTGSVSGSFAAPGITAPTTSIAPTFTAPTFTAPTTTIAPTFTAPTFTAPTTTIAPTFTAPTFTAPTTTIAPTFTAPTLTAPTTTIAPIFNAPKALKGIGG